MSADAAALISEDAYPLPGIPWVQFRGNQGDI